MEQNKKKGGAGRVILIILIVLVVLGAAGYFALRAFIQSKIESMAAPDLSSSFAQKAPDFALPLTDGSEAKLSELLQDHEGHPLAVFCSILSPTEIKRKFQDELLPVRQTINNKKLSVIRFLSGDTFFGQK